MAAPLPELPERYRCERLLGSGTTAEVYLARDLISEQDTAFKVVRRNLSMHRRFRARFSREVSLGARFVHPHLVPVRDAGVLADGRPFVAMALADQGNLSDLLRVGLRTTRLLKLAEQVCRALAALHCRGYLHLDLKPENVLIHSDSDGEPAAWVADLGIADEVSELVRGPHRAAGTPPFMAPEQLQGRTQELGPWTDLFALGLILHEALGGGREEGLRPAELLALREAGMPDLEPAPGIPEELILLVRNLLDPEPRQRYDRAADVRRLLRAIRKSMAGQDPELRLDLNDGEWSMMEQTGPLPGEELLGIDTPKTPVALRWNRVPPGRLPKFPPLRPPAVPPPASLALLAQRERSLVERDAEAGTVWACARKVAEEQCTQVVVITGGRGSGKSTLVTTLARILDEGGWMESVSLRYHSPPGVDDGSIGAVTQLLLPWQDTASDLEDRLKRWIARDRETTLEQVQNEARILTRWCGHAGDGPPPDAAVGLHYLIRHLDRRSWRGGSCLVLHDAHLAEESGEGLALAEAMQEQAMGERALLVLVTLNQEALAEDNSLQQRVNAMVEGGAVHIELPPMDVEQTQRMLERSHQVSPALARSLSNRMPNHPLYAGALLRDLALRGHLFCTKEGELELAEHKSLQDLIPATVEQLFSSRIQAALYAAEDNTAANTALSAIALAGPSPPLAVIKHVSEGGVDELLASGLVRQDAGLLRFEEKGLAPLAMRHAEQFTHTQAIHSALAQGWAALGERTGAKVDLPLGRHRLMAGQPARAVSLLLRSARSLFNSARYAAAGRAADLAIQAADQVASRESPNLAPRMEARRLKAESLLAGEQPEQALELVKEARGLGRGERLVDTRLQSLEARATLDLGNTERATRLLEAAHQSFWALRDREGQAEIALVRGQLARNENRISDAVEHYEEVLSHRPTWHRHAVAALAGLAALALHQGRPKRARRAVHHLADAAKRTGNTRISATANYAAGSVMLTEGHYAEAQRLFKTARANAACSGDIRMQLNALNGEGEVARLSGQTEEAESVYARYGKLAHQRGFALLEAVSYINRSLMALTGGNHARAEALAAQAGQILAHRPRSWPWLHIAMIRCALAAVKGEQGKAQQWWELAVDRGLEQVRSPDLSTSVEVLVQATQTQGWSEMEEKAKQILDGVRG